MASRGCIHPADSFCYICGEFIRTRSKKYFLKTSARTCEAYAAYFGIQIGDQDKPWAPHYCCEHCKRTMEGWFRGEKRTMKFAIPRIWRKPTDHSTNCYFCMVDPSRRRSGKNAPPIQYPDIPSSIAPVKHCADLPIPIPPASGTQTSTQDSNTSDTDEDDKDPVYAPCPENKERYYPNQKDLNDLVRDLGLTKSNAELLTSRLKEWNLLDDSVHVAEQRKRHKTFSSFFKNRDGLCFCDNVTGLFEEIGDILDFERRYQGQYNENMMGDYIWGLIRESDLEYRRKSRKQAHF